MCEKIDKIERMTQEVKDAAQRAIAASDRVCQSIIRSNGKIKKALKNDTSKANDNGADELYQLQ